MPKASTHASAFMTPSLEVRVHMEGYYRTSSSGVEHWVKSHTRAWPRRKRVVTIH